MVLYRMGRVDAPALRNTLDFLMTRSVHVPYSTLPLRCQRCRGRCLLRGTSAFSLRRTTGFMPLRASRFDRSLNTLNTHMLAVARACRTGLLAAALVYRVWCTVQTSLSVRYLHRR
jgi:hypothetical protein